MQVMDTGERLQGYLKSDLNDVVRETSSVMPAFGTDKLSDADLGDLLRFRAHARPGVPAVRSAAPMVEECAATGVSYQDLLAGYRSPTAWPSFSVTTADSGTARSARSRLTTLHQLTARWTFQTGLPCAVGFEGTPPRRRRRHAPDRTVRERLGTRRRTGRPFWRYRRELPNDLTYGAISPVNRGFGILGDRLFMVTPDAHVVSLDAKTGAVLWDTTMADYKIGHAATAAPLVIDGKVIVGISGGDFHARLPGCTSGHGCTCGASTRCPVAGTSSDTWPSSESMTRGAGPRG